jgi:FkbM family methyltransferase
MTDIPIVIICYNNYKYVENMIKQLITLNPNYAKDLIIVDNKSTCEKTKQYLCTLPYKVIYNSYNKGPWICPWCNEDIYNSLPDMFVLTDPDLELQANMPSNFVEILAELSNTYACNKVGCALDISDFDKMYQWKNPGENPGESHTIYDWEKRFWETKIDDPKYELYKAVVDTTLQLYNKRHSMYSQIRIAGNFTIKHLPWYRENKIYNVYENYQANALTTRISTNSKNILEYINTNYIKVTKNDQILFIENNTSDSNLTFWRDTYSYWEQERFRIFDRYLHPNKVFIDIGSWIGTTCIYASRKSKHVYCVEADRESIQSLQKNCELNCRNYTILHRAIFNIDNTDVRFGKNKFMSESKLNDSTSQIYIDEDSSENAYLIKTITLKSILENNKIDPHNISLIKVDIEGGEEFILEDLFQIQRAYEIPLYISFHNAWWTDTNLDRFSFLSEEAKYNIRMNPFISILFEGKA